MNIDISRLNLSEKDIENYLWEHPDEIGYNSRSGPGAYVTHWIGRQIEVPSGIIDLLGVLSTGQPVVVEVKNVPLEGRAVAQVVRYTHDIYCTVSSRYNKCAGDTVKSILIGTSIDNKTTHECIASKVIPMVFSSTMSLEITQIEFNREYEGQIWDKRYSLSKSPIFSVLDSFYAKPERLNVPSEYLEMNPSVEAGDEILQEVLFDEGKWL